MVLGPGAGPAPVPFQEPVDMSGDGSGTYPCLGKCPHGVNPPGPEAWCLAPPPSPPPLKAREFHAHRRPVIVDEARVAKKKRQGAGFVPGKPSIGIKTWMMVGVELDREEKPRHQTGRVFCCVIPNNCRSPTFQQALQARLLPNSLVWTDEHVSYKWLREAGHTHEPVNHYQAEFSRRRGFTRAFRKPKVTFAPIYRARSPGLCSEGPALALGPGIQERGWLMASTEEASVEETVSHPCDYV